MHDPAYSYGLASRLNYYIPDRSIGMFLDLEWNRRGGYDGGKTFSGDKSEPYVMDYIDINFGPHIGKNGFFGSGPYLGFLVHKGAAVDYPQNAKPVDFGGYITTGYVTKTKPRFLFAFDFKVSFINVYEEPYYFSQSTHIVWGISIGIGY